MEPPLNRPTKLFHHILKRRQLDILVKVWRGSGHKAEVIAMLLLGSYQPLWSTQTNSSVCLDRRK